MPRWASRASSATDGVSGVVATGSHRYLPRRHAPVMVSPRARGGEVVGAGRVPPHRAGVQHLGRSDGAPDHVPFQAPADDLDLG